VVKRGHESRMCETEMGTLQEEHRGGSDRDMRYEWVRHVWPMHKRASVCFYGRKLTRRRLLVLLNVIYWW